MKVEHQLRAFENILKNYDGSLPLHRFLVNHFKQNKQMGSSDRRWATRYIYSFYRLGKALMQLNSVERLAIADFLCHEIPSLVVEAYLPDFADKSASPLVDKIGLIQNKYPDFDIREVYAFHQHCSESIDKEAFLQSFFIQPDLFVRVKEAELAPVLSRLQDEDVAVKQLNETCLAMPNGTKLEHILANGLYQVQDYSSQLTGNYFKPNKWDYWWDCCAASGGKTLLLHSIEPSIQLLVSDVRESILDNLDERLRLAGLKKYHKKVIDLLQNNDQILHDYVFDGIILDAPCTGSGTWGRTPEMLTFFEERKIAQFAALQKAIVQNVVKYLKPGKPLIYITCSAFKEENEDVVAFIQENLQFKLEKMEALKGYENKADTMFVARLIKMM